MTKSDAHAEPGSAGPDGEDAQSQGAGTPRFSSIPAAERTQVTKVPQELLRSLMEKEQGRDGVDVIPQASHDDDGDNHERTVASHVPAELLARLRAEQAAARADQAPSSYPPAALVQIPPLSPMRVPSDLVPDDSPSTPPPAGSPLDRMARAFDRSSLVRRLLVVADSSVARTLLIVTICMLAFAMAYAVAR